MTGLTQRVRLLLLVGYVIILSCASRVAFGTWIPETGERGLWMFSGLAAVLLGDLLVSPYFTKPVDALSYSVAAGLALVTINVWGDQALSGFDRFLWSLALIFILLCMLAALTAIALKDSPSERTQRLGKSAYIVADNLGRPRWIFSAIFFFALLAYRGQSRVEDGFRQLKDEQHLAVRPQYHWTDQKIHVHTFVCLLGFLLGRVLEREARTLGHTEGLSGLLDLLGTVRLAMLLSPSGKRGGRPRCTWQLEQAAPEALRLLRHLVPDKAPFVYTDGAS